MASRDRKSISDYRHRVVLCHADEVAALSDGSLSLTRSRAWDAWAVIEEKRGSAFGRDGQVVKENRDQSSHEIYIRYRSDKVITVAAWVYEARLRSEPRWFKILQVKDVGENGYQWCMTCRLVSKSDADPAPQDTANATSGSIASPLPVGVVL